MTDDLIAGRYRIRRAIGRGGMGTVWLCDDELLERVVALKQAGRLPHDTAPDTARALHEARSSAALLHRNVVSVFDIVQHGDETWLVMEYVPGLALSHILRQQGPIPPRRAARIGSQVAAGLTAAHALGTVHRDVKPGNIFVGRDDHAKIGDFGIARTVDDEQGAETGLVTGTPAYFSPEMARGEDPGPEADVWALGATLYTAVEGHPPYPEKGNPLAQLQAIADGPPSPPQAAGPLTEAIGRMMAWDPHDRWTMHEAARALGRVAGGTSAAEADDTTALGAVGAVGAFDAGGTDGVDGVDGTGGTGGTPPAGAQEQPSEPRKTAALRRPVAWLALATVLLAAVGALGAGLLLAPSADRRPATAAPGSEEPSTTTSRPTPSPSPSPSASAPPRRSPRTQNRPTSPRADIQHPPPSATADSSPRPPTPDPNPSPDPTSAKVAFIEEYFETVPQDTDTGWHRLAPSMMRAVGRDTYESFWGSIASVQANEATPVRGEPVVEVVLTYTFEDGRVVTERQRIVLAESENGYRIADDQVLSSRTVRG